MRQPENISALLSLKPDYIGFIFYPGSSRYVGSIDQEVLGSIPATVKKTGVFVNSTEEEISDKINSFGLNAVQLHGNEQPAICETFKAKGIAVLKAFVIDESFSFSSLQDYRQVVDYFLFDTKTLQHGGSGKSFNWSLLQNYNLDVPYFLSGGLDAENIRQALKIEDERFYAVDLNSRFEIKPGLKDIQKLESIINKIRNTSREDLNTTL